MLPQSNGKMFLADERGLTSLDWFKSYCTFNFGNYQFANKNAFGNLYLLNDDMLAADKSIEMTVETDTVIILIPVIGGVIYYDNLGNKTEIIAGKLQVVRVWENTKIKLKNPYNNEPVRFLQIWVKQEKESLPPNLFSSFPIDLDGDINKLPAIYSSQNCNVFLGKFNGRSEGAIKIDNKQNGLFAFVISGAFEIQYRLLHDCDGLALWGINEIEFEALSNNAILLMIEIPVTAKVA